MTARGCLAALALLAVLAVGCVVGSLLALLLLCPCGLGGNPDTPTTTEAPP